MAKVLCVEDDPAVRDPVALLLELRGYEVNLASDGLEGVEKTMAWLPDIILMDLQMPRLDGVEAIKIIRKNEATTNIPIIVISGWRDNGEQRALEVGANEYLSKPVDFGKLMTIIARFLNGKGD